MRRFWVEPEFIQDDAVQFVGDSLHHLVTVSRFRAGDVIEVLCGKDFAYVVELTSVSKKAALGKIIRQRPLPKIQTPYVHLVLALAKPTTMDLIVEKAVELGCKSIQPVFSEHSQKVERLERWQKIIKSATEQSGRADLMTIQKAQSLKEVFRTINLSDRAKGLFLYEGESPLGLKNALKNMDFEQITDLWVFVGSEGGFSASEVQLFRERGLEPVTMGAQILRVETACVAILSVLKYELT